MLAPQTKCEKVALWYQAKSYLCRMQNVRSWFYATNLYNVYTTDGMLEGEFWWYQARTYLCRARNVKSWLWGLSQNILLLWTKY